MVPWNEIVTVAKLIYAQAEKAKVNKKQTKRLAERVRLLIDSVERAGNIADKEAYDTQLKAFKMTLDEALVLINKFHSQNWFYRFGKAGGWKNKLAGIHQHLTDHAEAFDLGMDVQGFINREADQQALSEDMEELRRLIVEAAGADRQTKEDLEAVVSALGVLKANTTEMSEGHAAILSQLDKLTHQLAKAISIAETEIVVVDEGATVGKLIDRYVAQEFNFKVPSGISNAEMDQLERFASGLRQAVPESKVKLTVVKKGGHVDDLLHETKDFLLSFELTAQSTSTAQTKQPAADQEEPPTQLPAQHQPSCFWQCNRCTFYTAAAFVVGSAAVAISQSETVQNYFNFAQRSS